MQLEQSSARVKATNVPLEETLALDINPEL
jgi:hypothetical protein